MRFRGKWESVRMRRVRLRRKGSQKPPNKAKVRSGTSQVLVEQ